MKKTALLAAMVTLLLSCKKDADYDPTALKSELAGNWEFVSCAFRAKDVRQLPDKTAQSILFTNDVTPGSGTLLIDNNQFSWQNNSYLITLSPSMLYHYKNNVAVDSSAGSTPFFPRTFTFSINAPYQLKGRDSIHFSTPTYMAQGSTTFNSKPDAHLNIKGDTLQLIVHWTSNNLPQDSLYTTFNQTYTYVRQH